jgi:hypothetical protein
LLFSFCDSVAALQALVNYNGRRGPAGNGPSTTIKYLRQTASDAAVNGLSTTMKYLRQTKSDAASYGRGTTIK